MTKVGMIMGLLKMENNILSLDSDLVLRINGLSILRRLLKSLAKKKGVKQLNFRKLVEVDPFPCF